MDGLLVKYTVFGLKCYICQSKTNPACGDVFTLTPDGDDVTGFCKTSCFKFVAARSDNKVISRGCLPSNRIIPECKKDRDNDIYGTFCACNQDFCNHGTSVHGFSLYPFFTVLYMILKIYM
ncbi:uncharacterized protein LOC132728523 isoform X2 [Ruditapes philippinarum]|uniref:uncharacterized protein LOC132728523 isoform X2 n=1 Tax=Ruditapes philippinarum TaxID=129788 RepID=UPI00295C1C58|nr:uncharacterized protein LOC132728523 isoform X2 [Ruditapes philippinarum]